MFLQYSARSVVKYAMAVLYRFMCNSEVLVALLLEAHERGKQARRDMVDKYSPEVVAQVPIHACTVLRNDFGMLLADCSKTHAPD